MKKLTLPDRVWELGFTLSSSEGEVLRAVKNGETAAEIDCRGGVLTCSFLFASHKELLSLTAKAGRGDTITVRYLEYRLELCVNGLLCDEEWPYGSIGIADAELTICPEDFSISAYTEEKADLPSVTGSFVNAEGWHPEEDVWVGDCMPFFHDGVYHVFYLKDRHHHQSKWGKGAHQWAHISTGDMVHWNSHPMAVEIDRQMEGSICTGSVVYYQNRFYAFYSIRTADGSSAPLCCSLSQDGYHFERGRMSVHVSEAYDQSAVRDPKVFPDGDGLFHMLVTTSIKRGEGLQGCLAHLTSKDLENWHEEPEPAFLTEVFPRNFAAPWSIEPECSDYFYKNSWYYLISRSQYWMSQEPFGPWIQPKESHIPCGNVPKMAFWKDNRVIFTGWVPHNGFGGTMTFREAIQREDGILEFVPVKEMKEISL